MSRVQQFSADVVVATQRDAAERRAYQRPQYKARPSQHVDSDSDSDEVTLCIAGGADMRFFTHAVGDLNTAILELHLADAALAKLDNIFGRQRQVMLHAEETGLSRGQRRLMQEESDALTGQYNALLSSAEGLVVRECWAKHSGGDSGSVHSGMSYVDVSEGVSRLHAREELGRIHAELETTRSAFTTHQASLECTLLQFSESHAAAAGAHRIGDPEGADLSAGDVAAGIHRDFSSALAAQANQDSAAAAVLLQ